MPKAEKERYLQKFREEWLKDPDLCTWLICKRKPDGAKYAQCKYCNCALAPKYSDLKVHRTSKKHQSATAVLCPTQTQIYFEKKTDDNSASAAEGRAALFIAEHCSIVTADHFTEFVRKSFSDSAAGKDYHMKRTKCAAIIMNVLYPHCKEDVKADIGSSKYSIIVDESTDIAVTKYLAVSIIYHSAQRSDIVRTFLSLCVLNACNADGIVKTIKCTLREHDLKLDNIVGIGTDNASVMVGVNRGVYKQLKADVPHLILIRCVCHSLQLAISAAVAEGPPRSLDYLVGDTYNWFARSFSRQQAYKELFGILNDGEEEPLKIVQACSTRWLSIATAVERVLHQWTELKAHFQVPRLAEKCYSAEVLYSMYCDEINKAYLLFLRPVLTEVQRVNKSFEAHNADQTKLSDDLVHLLSSLIKKGVTPTASVDVYTTKVEDYLDPKPYLGYSFEKHVDDMKKTGLAADEEENLRKRCTKFILVLIEQIRQRLPDNIEILRKVSQLAVEKVYVLKPSLVPLLEAMGIPSTRIDAIESQWRSIMTVAWKDTSTTQKFWCDVYNYRDSYGENPFGELADFAISMLVLPYSNAEVERSFSQMNLLKTKLRNRLSPNTVNAIMVIRAGLKRNKKGCFDYELPEKTIRLIGTRDVYKVGVSKPSPSTGAPHQPEGLLGQVGDSSPDCDDDDLFTL